MIVFGEQDASSFLDTIARMTVLHYSKERRLLWSVGPKGVDDGGRSNVDRLQRREMLRKIRPGRVEGPPNEEVVLEVAYDDLVFELDN